MYRLLFIFLILLPFFGAAQNTRDFFMGGETDISNRDGKRASKAIKKWSSKDGKQGDVLLSGAPFFWDYTKVGRPVFLRIIKNENVNGRLEVWTQKRGSRKFELYKTYLISFFSGDPGPKTKEGDFQAPEGFYYVSRRLMNPISDYHLAMDLGFPNAYDRAKGYTGSDIMIHGSTMSAGCFAMTDCSMEQIYTMVDRALKKGQRLVRVHCFPFAMTDANLKANEDSEHYEFWQNLKQGWDWFENNGRPPNVRVAGGKYVFGD